MCIYAHADSINSAKLYHNTIGFMTIRKTQFFESVEYLGRMTGSFRKFMLYKASRGKVVFKDQKRLPDFAPSTLYLVDLDNENLITFQAMSPTFSR